MFQLLNHLTLLVNFSHGWLLAILCAYVRCLCSKSGASVSSEVSLLILPSFTSSMASTTRGVDICCGGAICRRWISHISRRMGYIRHRWI